jgi:hypothetical protein
MHIGFWWESQKERKKSLGRPRCRCVDNIKITLIDRREWYGLDRSGSG